MWDDIVIGDSKDDIICSATEVFDFDFKPHDISQNQLSYWISLRDPDIGMKVYKDTNEGQRIKKMLDEKCTSEALHLYLFGLAMKHMKPERLLILMENAVDSARMDGYNTAKRELRNWLNV